MKRLRSIANRSSPSQSHQKRRRLFLLATAFVARGMEADHAYKMVLYYVDGPGRGRTWISALAEQDEVVNALMAPSPERKTPGRQEMRLSFVGQSAWPIGYE